MISHIDPEYRDRNMVDYLDPNGVAVIQEIIEAAVTTPEGGFVEYLWKKPSTGEQAPKLSFVKYYENWEWIFAPESISMRCRLSCRRVCFNTGNVCGGW
jgi:methyl-accepting chemotaxis protein